jgi:hypothetical protein
MHEGRLARQYDWRLHEIAVPTTGGSMAKADSAGAHWTLDAVPYDLVDVARARACDEAFYLVAAASFIETAADLYTDNLIDYFSGEADVAEWLVARWKPEELRHGRVLRGYVEHVWPEFDWSRAYGGFFDEYSRVCTVDQFEPTHSLEMVARCVVETGTATFYQALGELAPEPVLGGIAARIRADEVGHYKDFFRFFRSCDEGRYPGRLRVLGALRRRMAEARSDDAECALRHAYVVRHGGDDAAARAKLSAHLTASVKRHYPVALAARMLLKPLDLPPRVARVLEGPVARAASRIML